MASSEGTGPGPVAGDVFLRELVRFIGTTVTIYTTSGGQSGVGITGVLAYVDPSIVTLICCIGPAPCCCLGSACTGRLGSASGGGNGYGDAGRFISNVGSIAEIPVNSIAAYIHSAV